MREKVPQQKQQKTNKQQTEKQAKEIELRIDCPKEWLDFIFLKGYVAINGASLTVAKKKKDSFSVFLIPETLRATNLSELVEDFFLNIEVDQYTYSSVKLQSD